MTDRKTTEVNIEDIDPTVTEEGGGGLAQQAWQKRQSGLGDESDDGPNKPRDKGKEGK